MTSTGSDDAPTVGSASVPTDVGQIQMEELSKSDCWALLRSVTVGRLAVRSREGGADADPVDVDIFPINFIVDHGSIVFRTAAGTKLSRVAVEPRVTFEADNAEGAGGVAWSVIVKGAAEVIKVRHDVIEAFDLDVHPWHAGDKPTFVRVFPDIMTGRRFTIDTRTTAPAPDE